MRLKRTSDDTPWKPSIPDAISGVFLEVGHINNITKTYEDFSENIAKQIGSCPPIIAFTNDRKYFVIIEGIYYAIESLRSSLQLLFKSFYVFNLQYPCHCINFYNFIQEYFYGISADSKTSEVSSLITQMSTNI